MTSRFCRSTAAGQPAHQTATVVPAGCRMSAGAERSEPENAITDLSERFDRARFSATSFAALKSVKWARIVPSDLGRGCTLNVISQIVPTVPSAPMWSLLRSYPTTFFTTLPPLRTRWPFGSATCMPRTRSRADPYRSRLGPLEFVASIPPIVDISGRPPSSARNWSFSRR